MISVQNHIKPNDSKVRENSEVGLIYPDHMSIYICRSWVSKISKISHCSPLSFARELDMPGSAKAMAPGRGEGWVKPGTSRRATDATNKNGLDMT